MTARRNGTASPCLQPWLMPSAKTR
jgi:hypothetical protein